MSCGGGWASRQPPEAYFCLCCITNTAAHANKGPTVLSYHYATLLRIFQLSLTGHIFTRWAFSYKRVWSLLYQKPKQLYKKSLSSILSFCIAGLPSLEPYSEVKKPKRVLAQNYLPDLKRVTSVSQP